MLTHGERTAELIVTQFQNGELERDAFARRMQALEDASPLGSCYATWLLLKDTSDTPEKELHWSRLTRRLRAIHASSET